ncbi:hypothetical protein Tco_0936826 [Tanacetum coccineum]|uniref:CST complex subunit CTC1 n=1 Tax=Tanacetum coccineum TaxID=301880 RepID=A0ABQ5DFB6_9ASTR
MYKQIFWEKNTNACTAQVINHAKPQHGLLVGNFVKEDGCNKLHGYVVDDDDGIFPQHKFSLTLPVDRPILIGLSQGLLCFYSQHVNPNGFGSIKTVVIWNPAINKTVAIDVPDVLDALPYNYITVFGFGVCPHTSDPKLVKIICSHKMVGEKKFKSFPERSLRFLISFSTLESLPGLGDQLCTAQSMLYLGSGLLDSIEGSSPSPVRVQLFFLRLDLVGRGEENTGLDSSLPFPPGFTPADQVKSDRKNSPLHSHSDVLILVQASWRNAALLKIRLVKLWVLRWKGVRKTWRKLLDLKEFAMVSNELFIPKCSRLDPRPKRNDQGVKQQTTRLNFLSYSYTKSDHISDMDIKSMGWPLWRARFLEDEVRNAVRGLWVRTNLRGRWVLVLIFSQIRFWDTTVGEWSPSNLSGITNILHCFSLLSGLSINLKKSNLLGVGVRSEYVKDAAVNLGLDYENHHLNDLVGDGCGIICANFSGLEDT